jgi:hypothetical protein
MRDALNEVIAATGSKQANVWWLNIFVNGVLPSSGADVMIFKIFFRRKIQQKNAVFDSKQS